MRAQYLWGARRSEVTGKYAFKKEQLELTKFKGQRVALFNVLPAKTGDTEEEGVLILPRIVALPYDQDPWVPELCQHIGAQPELRKVWRFSDKSLSRIAAATFKPQEDGAPGFKYKVKVQGSRRKFKYKKLVTHGLRHFRVRELINRYGFDGIDIVSFIGWAGEKANLPPIMGDYAELGWRRYIEKLLQDSSRIPNVDQDILDKPLG